MAGHGFIQNKLEIKFLILYITTRVIQPIPLRHGTGLTMCDERHWITLIFPNASTIWSRPDI